MSLLFVDMEERKGVGDIKRESERETESDREEKNQYL